MELGNLFVRALGYLMEHPADTANRRPSRRIRRDLETMYRGERNADRVIAAWNDQRSLYGQGFGGNCPPGCQCGRLP